MEKAPPKRSRSRSVDKKRRRSPSSRSPEFQSSRPARKPRTGGFSNFSDKPPEEQKPKMSTQEILEYYKKFNPNQAVTNHNKAERQLYIGNIPQGLNDRELMELLNSALKELGKDVGIFQDNVVVGVWISGDGHYAFVDFKTAEDATQAFALQQVAIHGNYLKVGRPKNATGQIPHPSQLLCGNPNGMIIQHSTNNKKKNNLNKLIGGDNSLLQALNTKLHVINFPATYTKEMIMPICEVFGKVRSLDLMKDPATGEFKGQIQVEYFDEMDAKKGFQGMMGLDVGEGLLFVKRLSTLATSSANIDGEMFKALLDDRPTPCLMLRNLLIKEEMETRDDYKDLEMSVFEEMNRFGTCIKVHCPRPTLFGEAEHVPGFGKVFVKFTSEKEAEKAKIGIYRRRFNGRAVDPIYYPSEKMDNNQYD